MKTNVQRQAATTVEFAELNQNGFEHNRLSTGKRRVDPEQPHAVEFLDAHVYGGTGRCDPADFFVTAAKMEAETKQWQISGPPIQKDWPLGSISGKGASDLYRRRLKIST